MQNAGRESLVTARTSEEDERAYVPTACANYVAHCCYDAGCGFLPSKPNDRPRR